MPCHNAVTKNVIIVSPNMAIEDVMTEIRKTKFRVASVIDEDGHFLGMFTMKILLKNLIPVSVAMSDGLQIDIKIGAAPGVAKRLANIKPLPVSEVMERKPSTIDPGAPIWEGVSHMTNDGGPLPVVDTFGKYHGIITYDSLVESLENMNNIDG